MYERMQHLDIVCKSYEGSKFFWGRGSKIVQFLQHTYIVILEMYTK